MIGKTISHYKILEKLGEGGMGVVYKAQDTKLDRMVALKFLPHHLTTQVTERARFLQEAKATSALNHPNITTIHDISENKGEQFIIMEYIEGPTLKELSSTKMELKKIIEIAIQLCQGLQAAHQKQIVHRDIKSDNIKVAPENRVKIMDFGLAKLKSATPLTKAGTTVGTIAYMSPEQAQGKEVDQRTDLWSFGVVLYEMLTGKLPFRGEYEQAITYSILNEEPEPVTSLRSAVPVELEQIVDKALAKNVNQRYENADELLRDLRQVQESLKATSATTSSKSIAVLPLENISPDKENEYFSDGLTEEIIMNLSKIKNLKVISRTSAMHYKGTKKPLKQIAKELQVQYVLEGSVRKQGSDLRITAQLIDAVQDTHLWAEKYSGTLDDIFDIQEKVAEKIVEALKVKLTTGEQQQLSRRYTDDTEAYQLYLKGRYFWNTRTEDGFKKGIEYFNKAIEKDHNYALAYTGLADAYILMQVYCYLPPHETMPKARSAAQKALQIDPLLAEAHASLGHIKSLYDWDWPGAESEFKRSIELNPGYAPAYMWYGITFFAVLGRLEEALLQMKKARELDPLSLIINNDVGLIHFFAGRYEQAIEEYRRTLEIDSHFFVSHQSLGLAYLQLGRFDEAIAELQQALILSKNSSVVLASLGQAYGFSGQMSKAEEILARLEALSKERYVSPYAIALVCAGMKDKVKTLDWLQKAYEERILFILHAPLKVDPGFRILHSEPRYIELLKKVGLEK